MPEARWEDVRNYNQALLMAAQVRADLVDLLFRVWDESFGRAEPDRLGEDYFAYEDGDCSLADLWESKELERNYYRDNLSPSEDGRADVLGVGVPEKRSLGLYVVRYAESDEIAAPGAIAGTEGWKITHDATDGYAYLVNQSVDVRKFLNDPCPALTRFRNDARAVVDALRQD